MRRIAAVLLVMSLSACEGPVGPQGDPGANGEGGVPGPTGPKGDPGAPGDAGQNGQPGQNGCNGLNAGQTAGLHATIAVSAPANGSFFTVGEKPLLTITMADDCGHALAPGDVAIANLYLWGPRDPKLTTTASKLLNCVTDRAAPDHQHHFINLRAPSYADQAQKNLTVGADGTIRYQLAAIGSELPGTYSAGFWATNSADVDQLFPLVDLQIGVAAVEVEATGGGSSSSCLGCHQAPGGRIYMHHIHPGYSPFGDYSLDSAPITDCKACHNGDGYSPNPIVRKVHGIHRGEHQLAPGVAHPEYGLGSDATLAAYTDVGFPSMPGAEKDCASCHVDDRWKSAPSRVACGTCHDNVFFDLGKLSPPRTFGPPKSGACAQDVDCAAFGNFVSCNQGTGSCERRTHPVEPDDAQCIVCHSADDNGVTPTLRAHEIYPQTHDPGLAIANLTLSGGSGPNGAFLVGDVPTFTFQIADKNKTPIPDLVTNSAYSSSAIVDGPTDDRQRLYASTTMKASAFSYDANSATYKYVFATGLPATALAPLNTTVPFVRPNVAGTYTLWLWVSQSQTVNGQSFRNVANASLDFRFGSDGPVVPRQVISTAACNSCHTVVQAHGGGRAGDATLCTACHTQGAVDRTVGAKGVACTSNAQCPGSTAGWEACQDTNNDGKLDACIITVDPTPNRSIEFSQLVHDVHYARLREGYAEANDLFSPGALKYIGFNNTVADLSGVLLPLDVRNCGKCHADSGAVCSAQSPCGFGQACSAGKCVNRSWTVPSARACLTCHDDADDAGHAALNTWQSPGGPVETCDVCHGESAQFSVEKVHNVTAPFVPPYQREP